MNLASKLLTAFQQAGERVALRGDGKVVRYRTLWERSTRVAAYLRQHGIAQSCVAVECSDLIDHLTGIIGVVLSGNYYLSLTSDNKPFLATNPDLSVAFVIGPDLLTELSRSEAAEPSYTLPAIAPTDKLCAFFTSGSSGRSKLVVHTHATLAHQTDLEITANEIRANDRLDLVFSLSFSASLSCVFPALVAGAELCLFNLREKGLPALVQFWEEHQITFSTLSVSTFQGVCRISPSLKHLTALRFVSISAEPIQDTTLAFFHEKFPDSALLQMAYATTETRTISDLKVRRGDLTPVPANLIGRPVRGKTVLILDDQNQELPAGAVGEMVVESPFLADAYWGQPEESALAFSRHQDLIRYRTGDLGYRDATGQLFYAGRKTNAVKLNGIKINLTDIDHAVEQIAGVFQAATVIHQTHLANAQLVCFYKPTAAGVDPRGFRALLADRLPATHLPTVFVALDALPCTHSGKVDRKQLETYPLPAPSSPKPQTQPRTVIGSDRVRTLVNVFQEVLQNEAVGPDSHFFDMGGDSLKGLLCVARLEALFQMTVPYFALVDQPTPGALALYLEEDESQRGLLKTVEVNAHSASRKDLYILNYISDATYDPLISELTNTYNLIMVYYDVFRNSTKPGLNHRLLDQLRAVIGRSSDALVMGYSFDGYVAHQLATLLPQVSHCILIDTYHYLNFAPYRAKRNLFRALGNIVRQTVQYGDYRLPMRFLEQTFGLLKHHEAGPSIQPRIAEAVQCFIREITHQQASAHCIYFQANRTYYSKIMNHGLGWEAHFGGDFHFFNLLSDHITIIPKYARFMAEHIAEIVAKEPKPAETELVLSM